MKTLMVLPLSILLVACGGSDTPSSSSSTSAATPAEKTVPKPAAALTPVQRGAKLFKRCQACHTLEQSGRNKVGPNLWMIYGKEAGSQEAFAYSKAMKASDIVWDDATMDAYLKKPAEFMPGTKMSFIGLKKEADREAVQAYLKAKTSP